MNILCPFCKTQFKSAKSGAGRCPVCGARSPGGGQAAAGGPWRSANNRTTAKLWLAVALMLAAAMFAIVAFAVFGKNQKSELLTISVVSVSGTGDGGPGTGYSIKSVIRNFSDRTYSVPDIVFVIRSKDGGVLSEVAHLPPDGLIDPMSELSFTRVVEPAVPGAATVSARFVEEE